MMVGHGSYGHGGSSPSSTSNLSPLAPPFTVDRFMPKPIANPLVDLTETSYGVTFNHSLHNWLGSLPSNSRPDYFSSSQLELDTVPASNAYRYSSSSELVTPLKIHVSAAIDTDLYAQNSSGFVEAKPYYPSYVSSAIGTVNPSDIPQHSGYDLLSTSHVATPNGSLHENCTQNLSGLEHSAHWAGLWEGLTNWQQSEIVQLDGNICSKENYLNQGSFASEGMGKFEESSHSIDTVGMEKQTESGGREQSDYKSFLGEIPKFVPSVYPTSACSTSTIQVTETFPSVPSLKPVNSWNHQMPYGGSYEKCLRKNDVTPSDIASIINSSPAIVMRPAALDKSSLTNTNSTGDGDNKAFSGYNPSVVMELHPFMSSNSNSTIDGNNKAFSGYNTSVVMEPHSFMSSNSNSTIDGNNKAFSGYSTFVVTEPHPFMSSNLNSTTDGNSKACFSNNTCVVMETDPFMSSRSSLCYDASLNDEDVSVDAMNQFSGKKSRTQVPCTSLQGLNLVGDKTEGINSVKNHSENLDHPNPAVDSPCWKGAPITHFSQYEISEALTAQSNRKSEAYRGSNLQVHQILTLSGNDALKVSPERTSKNLMQQESLSKTPMVDNINLREGIYDSVKVGPHHRKPNCFDGVKIIDDSLSKNSFNSSDSKQKSCEGDKWTSEKSCSEGNDVADFGKNVNGDPDDCLSHVPFHAIEHVLCSPPSLDDVPAKFTEPRGGDSIGKMHVRTLIDTMQNLSALLVFHFSNNPCELKKEDHEALKDVIYNLELCMLENVEKTESATSQLLGISSNHKKDPNRNGSQISETQPVNVQEPGKNQHVLKEDYNSVSGKDNEKLSNFVSAMASADILKDDKITQALKKALIENFHCEEETEPQVLLYKNLWLEAEASLCAASCIARFKQMKKEMTTNDSENARGVMDKLSRSKVFIDPNEVNMLASDAKGSSLPDASVLESPILISSNHADDVAARFHVLKCRIDSSIVENTSYADSMLVCTEKLSNLEGSAIPDSVENLAFEEKAEMSVQYAALSNIQSHADDVEASVMSRFRILKQRVDNLTSVDREEHEAANLDLEYEGLQRQSPSEDRILGVNMEPQLQSHSFNSREEKLTVKEFHPIAKDDTVILSRTFSMPGDQSSAALCDGSSDWEHVLLEELAGQRA